MKLGVNIDHVATLRQQRKEGFPDPVEAAVLAQDNGADSIVAHLREDRRHIQDDDLRRLKKILTIPLAMEMAATAEMERMAIEIHPKRVCLVPEKRQELTTEGGLDIVGQRAHLQKIIHHIAEQKIEVSLFIDAEKNQIECAKALGTDTIELHTGRYAIASGIQQKEELVKLQRAAELAGKLGLHLHAGHGLHYQNVKPIALLPGMEELNIGFSIIGQSLFSGLASAVKQMKELI